MKEKILAVVLLVSIIVFSIANMLILDKQVSRTIDEVDRMSFEDENAKVTKSRLISYLEHLRRLSGLNIDAII